MLARVRVIGALTLGMLLVTAACAQDIAKPADTPLLSETSDASAAGFRPANPYFGNSLIVDPAPKTSASNQGEGTPAVELFGGYSYVRFFVNRPTTQEDFDFHGGTASISGNVNRWLGLVADFAGYKVADEPAGSSANFYTFLFGPKLSHRGDRWTPFTQFLFGAAHAKADVSSPTPGFFSAASFHQNAFAMALGAGIDLKLSKHVAWRIGQGEYLFTKFPDGKNNKQNSVRAATGLVFRFGGGPPPPPPNRPPVVGLTANPNQVNVGDTAVLQAQASDPDNDPLTYTWTATCGKIDGTGAEVRFNSADVAPGKCTATVKVDDGRGGTANASSDVTVQPRPNRPPTVSCAASPQAITAGHPVTLTATGSDPDNDPLSYTWDATGGKITGSGAQAQLDTTGVAAGHYTVNCHANDGRGGIADGHADVEVRAPEPAPEQKQLETRLSLHSIYFPTAQPTVTNPNGGLLASQERTLVVLASDFRKYLAFKTDAHLILQGHADPRGGPEYNKALSERRVARTKAFLVQQGVAAEAIDTQALGEEQPMSADQVKQAVEQDTTLTPAQKKQLTAKAGVLALAQNRRVDVTLSTTGQTSVRQFPFNAEDALNLINPRGVGTAKAKPKGKAAPKGAGTKKGPGTRKGATKKTP